MKLMIRKYQTRRGHTTGTSWMQQQQGAYGWIVATLHGNHVIWAAGPARGRWVNSDRVEGYGILSSVLHLFTKLFEYCQQDGKVEWQLTCDNSSMFDKIKHHNRNTTIIPIASKVYNWTQRSHPRITAPRWCTGTRQEVAQRVLASPLRDPLDKSNNYRKMVSVGGSLDTKERTCPWIGQRVMGI